MIQAPTPRAPKPAKSIKPTRPRTLYRASAAIALAALISACGEPDFHTHDGGKGTFDDWQGQWLVLNYWAEWCAPCIEEIPELNAFARQYEQQARVIGVNFDNVTGDTLQAQIDKLGIEFPVALQDPGPALGLSRPRALPTTYIFNPAGELSAALEGPQHLPDLERATGLGQQTP